MVELWFRSDREEEEEEEEEKEEEEEEEEAGVCCCSPRSCEEEEEEAVRDDRMKRRMRRDIIFISKGIVVGKPQEWDAASHVIFLSLFLIISQLLQVDASFFPASRGEAYRSWDEM